MKTYTFTDEKGRDLIVDSPDDSLPSEQELDQMFNAKYGNPGRNIKDIPESEFQQPNIALETAKGTADVIGKSAGNLANNLTFPVRHPIQTFGAVGNAVLHPIDTAKSIGGYANERYGSKDKIAETVANDPFGFVSDVAGTIYGASGIKKLGVKTADKAVDTAKSVFSKAENIKKIDNNVVTLYKDAIRPSPGRFKQTHQIKSYDNDIVTAAKAITENKDNLKLTVADQNHFGLQNKNSGDIASGLPKNKVDFLDSITQTKQSVWDKVTSLSENATNKGAIVDKPAIAEEAFNKIISNKQYKTYRPEIIENVKKLKNRIIKSGSATPSEIEADLKFLNNELQPYYKAGDYNAVNVLADYTAELRKGLDSSIENALMKGGYQNLRNQYKALRTVESDVLRSVSKQMVQHDVGLGSKLLNTFAGEEVARSMITMNPKLLLNAASIKAFDKVYRYLINPDRKIEKMFKLIDKTHQKQFRGLYDSFKDFNPE